MAYSFSELRQMAGMSVEDAAEELGYCTSTVYRWERGETAPKVAVYRAAESIAKLADKPTFGMNAGET